MESERERTLRRAAEVASTAAGLRPEPWMLTARVEERMRAVGASPEGYRRLLDDPARGPAERWALVESLRVGETRFFRHPKQLAELAAGPVAELAARHAEHKRVRAWSAGCATGQEAFTVAMVLCEAMPPESGWRIEVFGGDISEPSLEVARRGRYPAEAAADVPPALLARHFVADGAGYRVRPELARLVRFAPCNLLAPGGPRACDLVLCRNVLIHFDVASGERAVVHLADSLAPGGYLLLGHAESMRRLPAEARLEPLGGGLFRRPSDVRPGPPADRLRADRVAPRPPAQGAREGGDHRPTGGAPGAPSDGASAAGP
ncbi:MAG: hypothetical protein HY908_16220, partial [Myxococcales bacterium]|nr:hypothetical protein [Myxococcales bacterium]